MRSVSFENLTSRLPDERKALSRLKSLIDAASSQRDKQAPEYTFEYLFDTTGFVKPEDLALVLAELVSEGAIQKKVRVYSPSSGGGIGDFESVIDVPPVIFDWRADREVEVTPDNLSVIYRLWHDAR
jgi:hypothetical protein